MSEEIDVSECIFKVIRYCKIQTHILGDNARCDVNKKCYYKQLKRCEQKLEKIKEVAKIYRENCKIEGNCLDKRLCSTCYFCGGLEVCDDILDIIEGAEDD